MERYSCCWEYMTVLLLFVLSSVLSGVLAFELEFEFASSERGFDGNKEVVEVVVGEGD